MKDRLEIFMAVCGLMLKNAKTNGTRLSKVAIRVSIS